MSSLQKYVHIYQFSSSNRKWKYEELKQSKQHCPSLNYILQLILELQANNHIYSEHVFQKVKKVEKVLLFVDLIFFRPVLRVNRDSQVSCTQFTSQVFNLQLDWKNSGQERKTRMERNLITTITTERQCSAHWSTISFITEVKTNGESVKYKRKIK